MRRLILPLLLMTGAFASAQLYPPGGGVSGPAGGTDLHHPYGASVIPPPPGTTYTHNDGTNGTPFESGNCGTAGGDSNCAGDLGAVSVAETIDTVNGDVVHILLQRLGTGTVTLECSDANGEGWVLEQFPSGNQSTQEWVATIQNGGNGDVVTCNKSIGTGFTSSLAMIVDGYTSSTGWQDTGDGTPTDPNTANSDVEPLGPCNIFAPDSSSQANELVLGSAATTNGNASTASGYAVAQNAFFPSPIQIFTTYAGISTIQTPAFATDGTLTAPDCYVISFESN